MSIDDQIPTFLAISEAFLRAAGSVLPAQLAWPAAGPSEDIGMPCCGLRAHDINQATRTGSDDTFAAPRV